MGKDECKKLVINNDVMTWINSKAQLDTNMGQAFNIILGQGTDYTKSTLTGLSNWTKPDTDSNLLKLINFLKGVVLIHDELKYHHMSFQEIVHKFHNMFQNNSSDSEYSYFNNFKTAKNLVKQYGGTIGYSDDTMDHGCK